MKTLREKHIVIKAKQWFGFRDVPEAHILPYQSGSDCGWIDTSGGGQIVSPGDWIVEGNQGEFYTCKPDIFETIFHDSISPNLDNGNQKTKEEEKVEMIGVE